ncbi:hypothetical protein J4223_04050 [Candidatus Woesearchaeota archaeon]|nr:hypothetical protein [Candidatus Woesearchaeota archaeon]
MDAKVSVKVIIDKLTLDTKSIFSEKVYNIAAELGLGECIVHDCLHQLLEENYICEPVCGVLKKN